VEDKTRRQLADHPLFERTGIAPSHLRFVSSDIKSLITAETAGLGSPFTSNSI
jgi:hypothetical protein